MDCVGACVYRLTGDCLGLPFGLFRYLQHELAIMLLVQTAALQAGLQLAHLLII